MKPRKISIPNFFSALLVVVLLGATWKIGADCWETFRFKPEARAEMRDLWNRVELGDSQAKFERDFAAGNPQSLELRRWKSSYWAVRTPIEFGAGNWVLYVEFDERKRIGALRIRTTGSVDEKPRESAPADRVLPDWKPLIFSE